MRENFYKYLQDVVFFAIIVPTIYESAGKKRLWLNRNTAWRALSVQKVS